MLLPHWYFNVDIERPFYIDSVGGFRDDEVPFRITLLFVGVVLEHFLGRCPDSGFHFVIHAGDATAGEYIEAFHEWDERHFPPTFLFVRNERIYRNECDQVWVGHHFQPFFP